MEAVWGEVVQSTGFKPDDVHLLPVLGAAVHGHNQAASYPPGWELVEEAHDLLRGARLDEANLPEHINKYRVAIYEDVDAEDPLALAILAGKLRHELRHAEQQEAAGEDFRQLNEYARDVVQWTVKDSDNGGKLYHLMPSEQDANAASARFLRDRYADEVEEILDGEDAVLARTTHPPGNPSCVPANTVAFIFEHREAAEELGEFQHVPPIERLRAIGPRWAEMWQDLAHRRFKASDSSR